MTGVVGLSIVLLVDVFINGEPGEPKAAGEATLGTVIEGLRERLIRQQGLAIVSVTLDGNVLDRAAQVARGSEKASAFRKLEIQTIEPVSFSLKTLQGLQDHLGQLEDLHVQASEMLRAGSFDDASVQLDGCFQGWAVALQAVRDISSLTGISLQGTSIDGETALESLEKLTVQLNAFRKAYDERDIVTIGDLVRYELQPLAGRWRKVMETLAGMIREKGGASES